MSDIQIEQMRAQLDASFARIGAIDPSAIELRADFARYLCVRVSAFFETTVKRLVVIYSQRKANAEVANYVSNRVHDLNTINAERLGQLLGAFNAAWRQTLVEQMPPEQRDALVSIIANRHLIAHGQAVGLTYVQVSGYYTHLTALLKTLQATLAP